MNSPNSQHLTTDQLDAFLTESATPAALSHIATCALCATMVQLDRQVVQSLSTLPYFDTTPGFSDRVMQGLTPRLAPVVITAAATSPRAVAARRRAIGLLVLATGGVAAGFVWAAWHPVDALRWSAPALQGVGHTLWLSLQSVVAHATEQPWFSSVRDATATPLRAFFALAGTAVAYAIALTGLRRLMTEPATDAAW
jgi:hypothetical protein